MIDEFLYQYRWYVGGILAIIIVLGSSTILYDKIGASQKLSENQEMVELRTQNDLLREQLSNQAAGQVAGAVASEESQGDKININTASADELDKLPGIGPARAADIIAYRDSRAGGFGSIEEIKEIKGIGDKSFEDLKDLITVGGAE